jgi:hypothetical protein
MRSPSKAPPERLRVGSTEIMANVFREINQQAADDFIRN